MNLLKMPRNIVIFIPLILILILCLPINQIKADFSYTESDPSFQFMKLETYKDKTTVVRVVKELDNGCREPMLRLRIIYENGTVTPLDIDLNTLGIPEWNFCRVDMGYHRIKGSYALRLYSWIPNYVLITYMNGTSYQDQNNMSVFAKLITWSGEVIGNEYVGPVYIINRIIQYPIETHFDRIQPERGFFYADFLSETNYIYWVHFSAPNEDGLITRYKDGVITLENMMIGSFFYTIPTLGGGDFGIVIINSTISYEVPVEASSDPLNKQLQTYAIFISPTTYEQRGPYLLHNFGATPALAIRELACGIEYYNLIYNCFLVVRTNLTERSHFLTRISFTIEGSKIADQTYETNEINSLDVHEIYMETLYYGGYLLVSHRYNELNDTYEDLYGYIFDSGANLQGTWPFGNPLPKPALGRRYGLLFSNNTIVTINQRPDEATWVMEMRPITKFVEAYPYQNPNVLSTDPPNNSRISLRHSVISISFKNEIFLSTGNITIYQYQNSEKILRQTHSGLHQNCELGSDQKTITIKMLDSNFNIPNATYTVELAHEFFQDKLTQLAPLGLQPGDWNFTTENKSFDFTDSVDAVLGLTKDASAYFKKLSKPDQAAYMNQLSIDLAKIVPVESTRFVPNQEMQNYDNNNKILISIGIRQRGDQFQPNGETITKDLDTLIRNKNITMISRLETTNMLDEEFGCIIKKSVAGSFTLEIGICWAFLGALMAISILSLYFKFTIENLFILTKITLETVDVIFDIWFIASYSRDFRPFFELSITFFIVPTFFNIIFACEVLQSKDKNHEQPTILSYFFKAFGLFIDMEALKMIKEWDSTNANCFTEHFYWCKFAFQDIPQLIIQIMYFVLAIRYNTLIVLLITFNCLLIFHNLVIRCLMVVIGFFKT